MWDVNYEELEKVFLKDQIGNVLSLLPPRERTVLILRFFEGYTLEECGKFLGKVNRERIRQIEQKALRRLRNPTKFIPLLKDFIPSYERKCNSETSKEPNSGSIFSLHPAFREINLYAKKLPLLKKEEKVRLRKESAARESERIEEVRAQQSSFYAHLIKQQKDQQEKDLWWQSETETDFDRWYKQGMGRGVKH